MPLEDLIPLGYQISRPREDIQPTVGATVWGHGRQWNLMPDQDEEAVVVEATNHAKLYGKLEQAQTYFTDNYAEWPTMTAQQKDAANRQAQRALANLIRHVRSDLTSEGV